MLTYGSCKLEAADKEADMDLICIAPSVRAKENHIVRPRSLYPIYKVNYYIEWVKAIWTYRRRKKE